MTARKVAASESWDAFWAEVSGARTEFIRGVEVQVPRDVPFGFEERLNELSASSSREDIVELVERLFGTAVFDAWDEAGMGLRELQTALTWGMAQAAGRDLSFREAFELVQSDDEGKAPSGQNRAARRAAPRKQSASTGGPSKRTSSASTATGRKTSRA